MYQVLKTFPTSQHRFHVGDEVTAADFDTPEQLKRLLELGVVSERPDPSPASAPDPA